MWSTFITQLFGALKMLVIPSIDLYEGACVRLYQGDFNQATTYPSDPMVVLNDYAKAGCQLVHVVDLSAAKDPVCRQQVLIKQLVDGANLSIQLGGGIREEDEVRQLFAIGVDRVVLGSIAVMERECVKGFFTRFDPERIVLAFDVKMVNDQPMVAYAGWQQQSSLSLWDLLAFYAPLGLARVLCTDISRDGSLTAPNFALYEQMKQRYPNLTVQASGGVSCLDDIKALSRLGVEEVIVGKAIFENKIPLQGALLC
jgi:phosphoribosylformimino-5-aminoimidazole carboxamide ribotide isomerase